MENTRQPETTDVRRAWPLFLGADIRVLALIAAVGVMGIAILSAMLGTGFVLGKIEKIAVSSWTKLLSTQAILVFGATAMVMALEVCLLSYRNSSIYRLLHPTQSTVMDIVLFLLQVSGAIYVLAVIFSLGLSDWLSDVLIGLVPQNALKIENPVLQYIWVMLAVDFSKYWMHRFQHSSSFWWEAHKFHHAATEFNVITTARGHPMDAAMRTIFLAIPTALVGGSESDFLLILLVFSVHAGLTHSMINWTFGWVGRWIVVSPVAHRVHHSEMPEHVDKNFGAVFIIWDRIFGTYYDGVTINQTVGVNENNYNSRGLLYDFIECQRLFVTNLFHPVGRLFARLAPKS